MLPARSVDDNDAHANQHERDNGKEGIHGVGFTQDRGRHRRAKDGCHEAEDAYAAHGVCGEEPRPKGVCHGRDKSHVEDEGNRRREGGGGKVPAHDKAASKQHDASRDELPAREQNRVVRAPENGDETGGDCSGNAAEQDESFSVECERERGVAVAAKVYKDDTGKADDAADDGLAGEAFGLEYEGCKEDGEEVRRGSDDGAGDAGGMAESAVEKEALQHGLE